MEDKYPFKVYPIKSNAPSVIRLNESLKDVYTRMYLDLFGDMSTRYEQPVRPVKRKYRSINDPFEPSW